LCPLCLCGESLLMIAHHKDTENTEDAQRFGSNQETTGEG
jgi:hypothetical protein